jgi:biotin synthase
MSTGRLQQYARMERSDITELLSRDKVNLAELLSEAHARRIDRLGNRVYLRGIVEISNVCRKNCHYCGIRRDNHDVERFALREDEILDAVGWAFEQRYGSVVLQAGERTDDRFVGFVEDLLREIKALSSGRLGITLSLGEQATETYARWYEAGAHRYLLRIETSSPALYAKLHPPDHLFDDRVRCLTDLRRLGYQVGTGVMIGLPGQTIEDLANDVLFFRDLDVDMIGMGPYVLHEQTPLSEHTDNSDEEKRQRFELGLRMIAVCRLAMPDINIASTTALQALHPKGRELGLRAGANIVMPIITPPKYRKHYQLYQGKPCIEDSADECQQCLAKRIESVGDTVGYAQWGDSPHALRRRPAADAGSAR